MSHAHKEDSDGSTASAQNPSDTNNTPSSGNKVQGVTERPVDALEPYEFSTEIFDQEVPNGRFIQSVKEGLEKPLIITESNEVIDGVRRLKAAEILDWSKIEVAVHSYDDQSQKRRAVLRHNDHRNETFSQKMGVALKFEELIAPVMEKRMKKGRSVSRSKLDDDDLLIEAAEGGDESTQELVGNRVGWSSETYRKAKKIWRTAHNGKWPKANSKIQVESELQELAKDKIEELNEEDESIHSVFTNLRSKAEKPDAISWSNIRNHPRYQRLDRIEQEVPDPSDISSWKSGFNKTTENYYDAYNEVPASVYHPLIIYLVEREGGVNISNDPLAEVDGYNDRRPDSDRLEEIYWDEDLSLAEIAACYSVTKPVVNYWLREDDISLKESDAPN